MEGPTSVPLTVIALSLSPVIPRLPSVPNQILLLPLLPTPCSGVWYFMSTLSNHCSSDSCKIGIYGHCNEPFLTLSTMGHTLLAISFSAELAVHVLTYFLNVQLFICFLLICYICLFKSVPCGIDPDVIKKNYA